MSSNSQIKPLKIRWADIVPPDIIPPDIVPPDIVPPGHCSPRRAPLIEFPVIDFFFLTHGTLIMSDIEYDEIEINIFVYFFRFYSYLSKLDMLICFNSVVSYLQVLPKHMSSNKICGFW